MRCTIGEIMLAVSDKRSNGGRGLGRSLSTSGSRAASSLREAGLPCSYCRGLAHWRGHDLWIPLFQRGRGSSRCPWAASMCSCCCAGGPGLTGCYLEQYRLSWRSQARWPAGRPCCRLLSTIFPVCRCPQKTHF